MLLLLGNKEYGRVFTSLKGENIDLCLPTVKIPDECLVDLYELWQGGITIHSYLVSSVIKACIGVPEIQEE